MLFFFFSANYHFHKQPSNAMFSAEHVW